MPFEEGTHNSQGYNLLVIRLVNNWIYDTSCLYFNINGKII
ncbi:Uncharacterized protein BM_BM13330 [Brugia malayi]|uniref:Bm13330 n=1 Tax=Brugia malayi TaxID=6279 RepID=A0A0K0IXH8_BRUMA|nr:Uncharacterized protein BM_BM13330 [Brugia malayi]CDP90760.1 Bm13330 [Brugia malayi]VIO87172.1 Uncharacterized protein BM_BM13330 [Brugia malayi]